MFKRLIVLPLILGGLSFSQEIDSTRVRNVAPSSLVTRTQASKNTDIVNIKDFGAVCDGTTDDRVAIQAAIDATGRGTLHFPHTGFACAVSSPGIYLYPANGGMTLIGDAQIPSGAYVAGTGGGLTATAASPPATLLTIYAPQMLIENLYLDCHNGLSTNGFIDVAGAISTWRHVTTRSCSGDGGVVNVNAYPNTSITAGGGIGSSAITVNAITANRITFGQTYCTGILLGYGTSDFEIKGISSVVGSVINLSTPLAHVQTDARCAGNTDDMHISHYSSYANGGWGFRIVPGNDNNAFWWEDGSSNGNTLGGELWYGSIHTHYGGSYQGDTGPAIQLGEASSVSTTAFMTIGPPADLEEVGSQNNAVWAVCDNSSQVQFGLPSQFTITTAGSACANYPGGSTTTGFGTGATQDLIVKNNGGTFQAFPGTSGSLTWKNAAGATVGTVGVANLNALGLLTTANIGALANIKASTISGSGISIVKDVTDYSHSQLEASGDAQRTYMTQVGFNTSSLKGFIQATVYGSSANTLLLNPNGGAVVTGAGGLSTPGRFTAGIGANWIPSETGANNALVVALLDNDGTAVALAEGLDIKVKLGHTLQSGANTISFNSSIKSIVSARNPSNNINGTLYAVAGVIHLIYSGGVFLDMGQ